MKLSFDCGPTGQPVVFRAPREVITAATPEDVGPALAALDAGRRAGLWLAGYASYELGYALEPRLAGLMPPARRLPLLRFGLYEAPAAAEPVTGGAFRLGRLVPDWTPGRYAEAFEQVHRWIGAGDIYQANLTFALRADFAGDPRGLYAALAARQPVTHGVMIEQDAGPAILSRSPELFFRIDGQGRISARPMKGTAPRGRTPEEDADLRARLSHDEKTRAENLMIVDLLRNDLSRIAMPGSVAVPDLFRIETYQTVHQMVSQIEARLPPDPDLGGLLAALFPCGSVTGAPKIRAMEIIRALEDHPRELYCGAIGWMAPDGAATFNVAIRTLLIEDGTAVLNVGGGLVWDSRARSEYQEALWKSRFATFPPEPA